MESLRFTRIREPKKLTAETSPRLPRVKIKYGPKTPVMTQYTSSTPFFNIRDLKSQTPKLGKTGFRSLSPKVNFLDQLMTKYEDSKKHNLDLVSTFIRAEVIHAYWKQIEGTGDLPEARTGASMNVIGKNFYLFAGEGADLNCDLKRLDYISLSWHRVLPSNKGLSEMPVVKSGHISAVFKHFLVVYGGFMNFDPILRIRNCNSLVYLFDTVNGKWKSHKPTGHVPEARRNHLGLVIGKSLVIYSGMNSKGEFLASLGVLDLESMHWSNTHARGDIPPVRTGSSLTGIFHPSLSEGHNFDVFTVPKVHDHMFTKQTSGMYLFGGKNEDGMPLNDLYILKGQKSKTKPGSFELFWTKLVPAGTQPLPRFGHSACLCTTFLVIFGGQNDSVPGRILNDLVFLRINSWRWDPVRLHSEGISGRVGSSCAVLGSKVLIFGGMTTTGFAPTSLHELEVDQKKLNELFGLRRESAMSYLE